MLDRLPGALGLPQRVVQENGPEFLSFADAACAQSRGVDLDSIKHDKHVQNCFAGSVNGTFRDQCLNENLFTTIGDAIRRFGASQKINYKELHHSSLGALTPQAIAAELPSE